jgi:predicted Zn-dependent peptidase
MNDTVLVQIPMAREVAARFDDPVERVILGQAITRWLAEGGAVRRPGRLIELLEEIRSEAKRAGITDAEIDQALAADKATRRS